jgi:hypothetical protein
MLSRRNRYRWLTLAGLCVGTMFQFSNCREDVALLGLRTAFSSITLPINTLIRQFFLGLI